jgi:hypothetical protein
MQKLGVSSCLYGRRDISKLNAPQLLERSNSSRAVLESVETRVSTMLYQS